jgi:dihydropteroate synthase
MDISSVEVTHFPKNRQVLLKDKLVDLSNPIVMGIVNLTPDSFFEDSRATNEKKILSRVEQFLQEGATCIDIGAFSTRPGAEIISEEEEIKRISKPIQWILKEFPSTLISLDTFRGNVAKTGLDLGVGCINDISGGEFDPTILKVVADFKVPYILMHSNEKLAAMHSIEEKTNLFQEMMVYFSKKIKGLNELGVHDVIIDPGFGFGKTEAENYFLLHNLNLFHVLERPILVGISRKSMLYKKLKTTPEQALNGTTVLNTLAIQKGASILRVHDVKEAMEIIQLLA